MAGTTRRVSGADSSGNRWAIENASSSTTSGKVFLGGDDIYTYFGTGLDSSVGYDSTNNSLTIDGVDVRDIAIASLGDQIDHRVHLEARLNRFGSDQKLYFAWR